MKPRGVGHAPRASMWGRRPLLASVALGILACGEAGPETEVPFPDWDLVFYSDRSGNGDLFLIAADDFRTGSFRARRILGTGAADYNPRWVPEGPGLVFLTDIEAPAALYGLRPEADGIAARLGTNPASDEPPAFAPDGETLVYDAPEEGGMDLFVRALAGGTPERISYDGARKAQPAVAPDGEWVVFGEGPEGRQNLVLMRLDGSERRVLTDGNSNDSHPFWLPDGSGILFDSNRVGVGTDIFHLDLASGTVRNLTNDPGIDLVSSVSPDGEWVAFGSSRSGNWDLYIVPFTGGAARQITAEPTFEGDPRWVPAGLLQFPDQR